MPSSAPDTEAGHPDPHRPRSTSASPRPVDSQPPAGSHPSPPEPVQHAAMTDDELQPASTELLPAQLDEANTTIARLRAELASLPAYYTSRNQLDHDRLASDNLQLRTQAHVLARKVAALEADKLALASARKTTAKDKGKGKARADDDDEDYEDDAASEATEVDEEERDATIAQLESDKRALTVDVHRLQDRLDIAEQQTKRLSHELRSLRAYFLHGSPLVTLEADVALPSPPASQISPASPPDPALPAASSSTASSSRPGPTPRSVALADAEAELLLHAGKTLSHVHRVTRVPLTRAIAERADDIVRARAGGGGGGEPYSLPRPAALGPAGDAEVQGEGHDGLDGLMQLANASSQEDLAPLLPDPSAAAPAPGAGAGPSMSLRTRTSSRRARASRTEWDGPDSGEDAQMGTRALELPVPPAQYNPYSLERPPPHMAMRAGLPAYGGGFAGGGGAAAHDDDPDYLPSPPPGLGPAAAAAGSNAWPYAYELPYPGAQAGPSGASLSSAAGPSAHPHAHPGPNPRQALGQRLSALDVLAQATAEMDHEGLGGGMVDHGRGLYEGGWERAGEAQQGAKGDKKAGVPSSRSRVPTVGPDGQKKPRSPYIKWNLQEDEQLLRAVIQVGCSWDNVAKLCPTRAYHQVRQRFLRGLRSGEQLPKQLMHLQEAVRKSVRDHEAKKKRKRAAKQHVAVSDPDDDA
ncbi:hypothetical protein JCM9279_005500 [Rhodotorula babjevae]